MFKRPTLAQNMIQQKELQNKIQSTPKQQQLTATNQTCEYFSFRIQQRAFQDDSTAAWKYNVPVLNPNQRNLYLATEGFTTTIIDYVGDNFPQTISICLRNFSGFISKDGLPTSRIIVLNLFNISSSINSQGVVSRDLVYKNDNAAMWQLGTLRNLVFQIKLDDEQSAIQFPITNSIAVSFKILHMNV